jgi:hypothetical protein
MSRTQIALLAALLLIAALILVLAFRNPSIPFLPDDADHLAGVDGPGCLECHGPDAIFPRGQNHPVGQDCFRCHARR